MDPNLAVDLCALTDQLMPEAARLLGLYTHPDDHDVGGLAECLRALQGWLESPSTHFWLARVDGRYVGFVSLAWSMSTSTGPPVRRIEGLYTLPGYRRRGVATELLSRAAELARQHGANRLQLETDTDNVAARRLYERLGFEGLPRKEVYMRFL